MVKRIMSVDDSARVRQMVSFILESAGYQVATAVDGRDALTQLGAAPFDLVITDLNMPNLNGMDLTRALRALPQYRGVPIILLTSESQDHKKAEGKAAGATGWIVKPFQQDQLLAVVRKVLG